MLDRKTFSIEIDADSAATVRRLLGKSEPVGFEKIGALLFFREYRLDSALSLCVWIVNAEHGPWMEQVFYENGQEFGCLQGRKDLVGSFGAVKTMNTFSVTVTIKIQKNEGSQIVQ